MEKGTHLFSAPLRVELDPMGANCREDISVGHPEEILDGQVGLASERTAKGGGGFSLSRDLQADLGDAVGRSSCCSQGGGLDGLVGPFQLPDSICTSAKDCHQAPAPRGWRIVNRL